MDLCFGGKEDSEISYFKLISINGLLIVIFKDRKIDYQLPLFSTIKRKDIKIETFIDDLIKSNLIEKINEPIQFGSFLIIRRNE